MCGGPWGTSGNCSPGTRCLRSCGEKIDQYYPSTYLEFLQFYTSLWERKKKLNSSLLQNARQSKIILVSFHSSTKGRHTTNAQRMNQLIVCHGVQQELTDQEMFSMESGRTVKKDVLAQVMIAALGIYSMLMENASMKGEQ